MNEAVLLLDIGNTRIKWAMFQNRDWLADGFAEHERTDTLTHEWDRFPSPRKVIGCNVAGENIANSVSDYWKTRGITVDWIRSEKTCSGVINLYDNPEQLGPDRWAALIGAWHRAKGSCLVVSAGTAMTVDMLNQKGEFVGGFILPGKHLMHESLVKGTHALEDLAGHCVDLPRNTADGMASGLTLSATSSIQTIWNKFASGNKGDPPCFVTGGDAEWLAKYLQISVIIAPKLVMEGLLIMARESDQE